MPTSPGLPGASRAAKPGAKRRSIGSNAPARSSCGPAARFPRATIRARPTCGSRSSARRRAEQAAVGGPAFQNSWISRGRDPVAFLLRRAMNAGVPPLGSHDRQNHLDRKRVAPTIHAGTNLPENLLESESNAYYDNSSEMETHVKERELFTRRAVTAGSIASLLAITGKPRAEARAQFVAAADGKGGADLVVLDPNSPRFAGLTQGFNRRWSAPNCSRILVPLTEAGAHKALDQAISWGPGNFRVRGGGHCYEDFVFSDRTQALIDMSLLNEIGLDARNGVYYAQSGSTTWDLYRQLYWRFGLTLPGGS